MALQAKLNEMASPFNCRMKFSKFVKHFPVLYLLLLLYKNVMADDVPNDFHGEERDALLALVAGFNNPFLHHNWTKIMCYKNDPPRWFGIECSNGRVTGVRLENLGLTGEIKVDALFNLTKLSILSLKDNSISGNLMDFSNNLNLTEIDLSGNRFNGEIPLSLLRLSSLASLQLQDEKHILHEDEEKDHEKIKKENGEKRVAADGEVKGKLVFMDEERHFELDDLLKASAEGLGKGNFGNCYKAMLEIGPIVVVKRLRDLKPLSSEEFMKQIRVIAEQKHTNLLPLLAYYSSNDEKLLLYKYASNGNVYNRLHEGKGKPTRIPLRWSARLSVARGVARALEYLHMNIKTSNVVPHGNLKLSNVLLDENDGVLVTDYGLTSLITPPLAAQRMISFKSPEYQSSKKISRKSDVWSYGCLLLELVTGKVSADSAQPGTNAVDLCSWVHRAVREEWTAEIFDVEIAVQRSANHGMLKLLQIGMRCCEKSPQNRPEMTEVLREVESIMVTADSEDEDSSPIDRSLTDESMSATPSRSIEEDQR